MGFVWVPYDPVFLFDCSIQLFHPIGMQSTIKGQNEEPSFDAGGAGQATTMETQWFMMIVGRSSLAPRVDGQSRAM